MHVLLDLVGSLARRRHFDLDRIGQVVMRQIGDRLRHGGREQKRLALGRDHLGNLAEVVDEAEIEHLVRFIKHQIGDLGERDGVAGDEIKQAAGGRHQNVRALFELELLLVDRCAADHLVDAERRLLHEGAQVFTDLVHQLARRGEDKGAAGAVCRAVRLLHQHFDDGQAESGGLAGAGLCEADQVAAFEQQRNGLCLNGSRGRIAKLGNAGHDLFGEAEFAKTGQYNAFRGAKTNSSGAGLLSGGLGVKNPA
ncbi:hypothetical protein D3C78_850060 [compost metagenome]